MSKSLYAVLNVAPDADPAVIEAAYKALMKKYHPDVLHGAPTGDARKAAEINEAFQILRDPERRARYDSNERARQDAFRRAAVPPGRSVAPIYHAAPLPRRRSRWPKLVLVLAAAAAALFLWNESDEVRRAFGIETGAFAAQTATGSGPPGAVKVKDVERALAEFQRIKDSSGLVGLSAFSQDCFADQGRLPTASDLDFCVAFDHAAAVYDAKIAGDDLPQLRRFQPTELSLRHETAARLVSGDKGWVDQRLTQLRRMMAERLEGETQQADAAAVEAAVATAAAAAAVKAAAPIKARKMKARKGQRHARYKRGYRKSAARSRDRDFLEREGYIY